MEPPKRIHDGLDRIAKCEQLAILRLKTMERR
ncbi:hypothetical protein FB001_111119 [Ensifer sp. SEMIA 135]|nr:hypothetical protein FB000_11977 [Ensifer sp. SEMIA 134]TWB33977.1 hypothetical protein FB001_111119 [Ensifer sp. SEMIA 135]